MSKSIKALKLKQISSLMKAGSPINIDNLGARLKDIREVLGMTQKQLAQKMKVKQPLIARIEKNSKDSSLNTLSRVANALGCELTGAVVSREPLEGIIKKRAGMAAKKMLNRTFANMALEKQSPNKGAYEYQLKELTEELASNPKSVLWEE